MPGLTSPGCGSDGEGTGGHVTGVGQLPAPVTAGMLKISVPGWPVSGGGDETGETTAPGPRKPAARSARHLAEMRSMPGGLSGAEGPERSGGPEVMHF